MIGQIAQCAGAAAVALVVIVAVCELVKAVLRWGFAPRAAPLPEPAGVCLAELAVRWDGAQWRHDGDGGPCLHALDVDGWLAEVLGDE